MSTIDRRLSRVAARLRPQERAAAIIHSWNAGQHADPLLYDARTAQEKGELGDLLTLARDVHDTLSEEVRALTLVVAIIEARCGTFASMWRHQRDVDALGWYVLVNTPEPITEADYAARVRAKAATFVPVRTLAEDMVNGVEDAEELDLTDREWARRVREEEARLRGLLAEGCLVGKASRRKASIELGSYYRWRGLAVPIEPDFGLAFQRLPDKQQEQVARRRAQRERVRDRYAGLEALNAERQELAAEIADNIGESWRRLRAIELVLEEVTVELGGQPPLEAEGCAMLVAAKTRLAELAGVLEGVLPAPFEEPDEDDLEHVRGSWE